MFPCEFCKISKDTFLQNTSGRLLLTLAVQKSWFYVLRWQPFKNDVKHFLFHLKSFFRSWDKNFCPNFFGHVGERLDKKPKFSLKICNIINWETNNYNTYYPITREIRNDNQSMKLIEHNVRIIFLEKSCREWRRKTSSRPLFVF